MNIIKYLFYRSKTLFFVSSVLSVISAILVVAMIFCVNEMISGVLQQDKSMLFIYFAVLVISLVTGILSQAAIIKLGFDVTYNMLTLLIRKVLSTDLRKVEKVGKDKLYASVTQDVDAVVQAINIFPHVIVNVTMVVAAVAYLFWMSAEALLGVILIVLLGMVVIRTIFAVMHKNFTELRERGDALHECYEGFFYGTKELKIDRALASHIVNGKFSAACEDVRRLGLKAGLAVIFGISWFQMLFSVAIGMVFALMAYGGLTDMKVLIGYVMVLLFVRGPASVLFEQIPRIVKGNVALKKIAAIDLDEPDNQLFDNSVPATKALYWQDIELKGVSYHYENNSGSRAFSIGPVNLTIRAGDVVFITGGNGSGKTTLAKIITGLYQPTAGAILVNGAVVEHGQEDKLRELFATIFSDYYLFNEIAELYIKKMGGFPAWKAMLKELEMQELVDIEGGGTSSNKLSTGQKKRLALFYAYAMQRPVFLFDEWAADQDPVYREYFYTTILPKLREEGKGIVVISHDDKYFSHANKLYKLEDGRLTTDVAVSHKVLPVSQAAFLSPV